MAKASWDNAVEAADVYGEQETVAYVTVTKVIRESQPLVKGTRTIGQQIDEYIAESVKRGDEVQSVSVDFDPELWRKLAGR